MHNIIAYKEEDNKLICSFTGRLDSVVSEIIEEDLLDHIQKTTQNSIIFDFKNVDYISSAFLRINIKAARMLPKTKLTIVNALPTIKEIYKMTGLDKIFIFKD